MKQIKSFTLKDIFNELPEKSDFVEGIRRAPKRDFVLSKEKLIFPSFAFS